MQGLIDALRAAGAENVLLVDGLQFARNLAGAPPLDDPLGQLGYAVHPYLGRHNQTPRAVGRRSWAASPATHPVMATEWNAAGRRQLLPAGDARRRPRRCSTICAEQRIGLVAWALDMPNLREPDGSYTTLDDLVCGERRTAAAAAPGR